MAVTDVQVTCNGASGTAAPFVVMVRANGQELTQEEVTGQPVPRTGGEPWSWSFRWDFEGHQEVTIFDVTHDGAVTHLVNHYPVDCPLPSTTAAPTTAPVATMPVPVEVVEPSVPTTLVELSTVAPSTTNYSGLDDFYVAVYEPDAEPVGCCADYVAEVGTSPMLPATGPEHILPMVGMGMGLVVLGLMLCRARRVAA